MSTEKFNIPAKVLLTLPVLFLVFGLLISDNALAERATGAEMDQVCQNWLDFCVRENGSWAGSQKPEVAAVEDIMAGERLLGRIYSIAPNGYIVVPVMKELPPIKATSENYRLDELQEEGMKKLLREVLQNRAEIFIARYGSLDAAQPEKGEAIFGREDRVLWDIYTRNSDDFRSYMLANPGFRSKESVGPLLTTAWHQNYPYNIYCPDGDGGKCVVGCVATAAAQILWFWQWPPAGEGSHTYYWNGDQSCGGNYGSGYLSADFFDDYGYGGSSAEMAEISYETGVAFEMDYGHCASGIWTSQIPGVIDAYEQNFRYMPGIIHSNRSAYMPSQWWYMIKQDLDAGRPLHYFIIGHSIVCDGWREVSGFNQYHMNYGWGGSNNTWYTLDNLYCPGGCDQVYESMLRGIEPDKGVMLMADTCFGAMPLEVNFTGESDLQVDTWTWDFGDGDSAVGNYETCLHNYEETGIFDVTLQIDAGGDIRSFTRTDYIIIVADTMIAMDASGNEGAAVEVPIYANNEIALNLIRIPITYNGDLVITFDSFSTAGCRTDYFASKVLKHFDPANNRITIDLESSSDGSLPDLEPGSGLIAKVYFTVQSPSEFGQTATIDMSGYSIYQPQFKNILRTYQPELVGGTVSLAFMCGDVNDDQGVNLLDIVYLINYKYKSGPAPEPMESGDVNSDTQVNILDIIYLINFKYKEGPEPDCP